MRWACNSVFDVTAMHSRQHLVQCLRVALNLVAVASILVVTVSMGTVAMAAVVIAASLHGLMQCFLLSFSYYCIMENAVWY